MSENRPKQKRKAPPTAFKPGQSGNPGGRPKEMFDLKAMIRRDGLEKAYQALITALEEPGERVPAAKTLLAYGVGLPSQHVSVTHEEAEKLSDMELLERTLEALPPQMLQAAIERITEKQRAVEPVQ